MNKEPAGRMVDGKMKKWMARLGVMCLCLMLMCGFAAAEQKVTAKVPVKVALTGDLSGRADTFLVRIRANKADSPMPETAEISVKANDSAEFRMEYTTPGVYEYTLTQDAGTEKRMAYDSASYRVVVSVFNGENGLETIVVAYKNDGTEKQDSCDFSNRLKPETTPKPTDAATPAPTGSTTPTGVEDNWPKYLIGAAVILAVGIGAFIVLRRKDEDADENNN